MAYRQAHVNKTKHIVHDLDLINAEVNRALDQYPETWTCHNALIVTWSISRISDVTVCITKTYLVTDFLAIKN